MIKSLFALIKKDFLQELRSRETLLFIFSLSVLLSVIIAFGIRSSMISSAVVTQVFPGLLWIVMLLTSTVAIGRSFEYEQEHMAIDGIILSGTSPVVIFFSKFIVSTFLIFCGNVVALLVLSVLLNVDLSNIFSALLLINLLVVLSYTPLSCLVLAISSSSRVKSLLMPLLMLPLMFPVFLGAVEVTHLIFEQRSLDLSSFWLSLLIGLDVIYIVLGLNLYPYVIKE